MFLPQWALLKVSVALKGLKKYGGAIFSNETFCSWVFTQIFYKKMGLTLVLVERSSYLRGLKYGSLDSNRKNVLSTSPRVTYKYHYKYLLEASCKRKKVKFDRGTLSPGAVEFGTS